MDDAWTGREHEVFQRLFPHGPSAAGVVAELAPDGWAASPLLAVFHPSVEQVYEEALRLHRNLLSVPWRDRSSRAPPAPRLEEIRSEYRDRPIEVDREVRELLGLCLWDIVSDNHKVVTECVREIDFGSFRASAGTIAVWLNGAIGSGVAYDYMDFYLGTIWVRERADLTAVYRLIFRRLRAASLDWIYHFPRLGLVRLGNVGEGPPGDTPEWAGYDPSEALARKQEEKRREEETARLEVSLTEAHRENVERARRGPPPKTVEAYRSVYGHLPRGWPP